MSADARILVGDVRESLRGLSDGSVRCVVTSPPYWGLRDYGNDGQIGLEQTPELYVAEMVEVFREVRRVLADDGTLWLNLGDSYYSHDPGGYREGEFLNANGRPPKKGQARNRAGNYVAGAKRKDLVGIPWRVAFALQADGWYLRQDIIWAKPNPMPESVTDRCTKAHEYVFLMTKKPRYYYNAEVVREPFANGGEWLGRESNTHKVKSGGNSDRADKGARATTGNPNGRNRRSVWTVTTKPFKGAHFAVMPEALAEPCVLAGSAAGDTVLDPFSGSGTVGVVSLRHGRNYIGCELNPKYADLSRKRICDDQPLMNTVEVQA
jgi:DNA modification methylase